MRKGLFLKLAWTNIRKNRETYVPYMLTCVFCVAMQYMMLFLNGNRGIDQVYGSANIRMLLSMGSVIILIFSALFLLYSDSFVMKRRQKELALYNILGLEKGHIGWMMLAETVMTSAVSLAAGIAAGILGSKLALLLLLKLLKIPAQFGFEIPFSAIAVCSGAYGILFLVILVFHLARVHVSRPVELLRGGNAGEKEPKANGLIALLGAVCLAAGYGIALTVKSVLDAWGLFFVAVLLVMAGTYLLFTAGSIVVLKLLRRKKSFYYKTNNFTAVSGMLYRMKQNAMGLASICILSTGVLLMLSMTVCLYFGFHDIINSRYPYDAEYTFSDVTLEEGRSLRRALEEKLAEEKAHIGKTKSSLSYETTCFMKGDQVSFLAEGISDVADMAYLVLIPQAEYEAESGEKTSLSDGSVLAYCSGASGGDTLSVAGEPFRVAGWLDEPLIEADEMSGYVKGQLSLVVTDQDFEKITGLIAAEFKSDAGATLSVAVDFLGTAEEKQTYADMLRSYGEEAFSSGNFSSEAYYTPKIRQEQYDNGLGIYGGLFFLGIFLGALFMVGTVMIISYKQMSEGYEDQRRFEIMQKVGMTKKEVRSSIRRQILMVFYLPLLVAILHVSAAFPLVRKMLLAFGMSNTRLLLACTAGVTLAFAAVYAGIYWLTARTYYRIVEKNHRLPA